MGQLSAISCRKIASSGNKMPPLPRGDSCKRSTCRYCREATKLAPSCLVDVTTTVTGNIMKKVLLASAAIFAFAAPAFAADLPAQPYTKAPAYTAPEAVYNWTGFYIGGHLGGAFAGNNSLEGNGRRFFGGVQGGFGYQFSPNLAGRPAAHYSCLAHNTNNTLLFPAVT